MSVTIEELTDVAADFLREAYGLPLEIPIQRNNRLRSAQGMYVSTYEDVPLRIEIAGRAFKYAKKDVVIEILKHECIHYALDVLGKPNDDGHPVFEAELIKHGAPSTNMNYIGVLHVYACAKCNNEFNSEYKPSRALRGIRVTRCCKSHLEYVGERIYDGTEPI